MSQEANLLEQSGLPIFFGPVDWVSLGFEEPENRHGQSVRVWARSLTVMQKEALVLSPLTGKAWRVASDEGPYLNGFDSAPCPLAFLTVGMVASYMNEVLALAEQNQIAIDDIRLIQDNRYTMEGSALRGTMVGGALPVDLEVRVRSDADETSLRALVMNAVAASPLNGLMRNAHDSLFTLTANGDRIPVGRVAEIGGAAAEFTHDGFERLRDLSITGQPEPLLRRLKAVDTIQGVAGGAGTSLSAEQSRTLHVRATATRRPDGVKEIHQELFSPIGSTFRFFSDEAQGHGGTGAAPDAASYISAGIAFCFMTQLGRYAKIVKKDLGHYNVVQDAHFSLGGASGGTGQPGHCDPIETHVDLVTSEDDDFARVVLDMGEQTCFLHGFCRTELKTKIKLTRI